MRHSQPARASGPQVTAARRAIVGILDPDYCIPYPRRSCDARHKVARPTAARDARRARGQSYGDRSYYEMFIGGLLKMLDERGLVSADELAAGRSLREPPGLPNVLLARDVVAVLASGAPSERPATTQPRFAIGQHVRTYLGTVPHHTGCTRSRSAQMNCGPMARPGSRFRSTRGNPTWRRHDPSTAVSGIATNDEPVFQEPWEARAFAIVVSLHKRGHVARMGRRAGRTDRRGPGDRRRRQRLVLPLLVGCTRGPAGN